MKTADLRRVALRAAIRERRKNNIPEHAPISIIDFCDRPDEVEVWFVDEPRLEGMYCRSEPCRILISSHRTIGRQAITCAHEYGHHIFKHGTRHDMYTANGIDNKQDSEEILANTLAHHLIMPKAAVKHAFNIRGIKVEKCTPAAAYLVASQLGVSYSGLLQHLHFSLRLIDEPLYRSLTHVTPKAIRESTLGFAIDTEMIVVDYHWNTRAIDAHVGDILVLPEDAKVETEIVEPAGHNMVQSFCRAIRQGIGRVTSRDENWCANIRISRRYDSRKTYRGRAMFRHWEDPDD